MSSHRLSRLQVQILKLAADIEPRWRLTGGGALCGFHLGHRLTADLDLFWAGQDALGPWADEVSRRLERAGLKLVRLQDFPGFRRLQVSTDHEDTVVDLVADPVPTIESPEPLALEGTEILVDTRHEILVNKLNTLLSRSEPRDLFDVRALLALDADLAAACTHASLKDGGFSPLTLAWVLETLHMPAAGPALGLDDEAVAELARFRDDLRDALVQLGQPAR